jgi:hypothetical protein
MAADATGSSGRPRPWLLVALGIALVVAIVSYAGGGKSAAPTPRPSNPRTHARAKTPETVKPADLVVRLEDLRQPRPPAHASDRNPFRFYTPPPPPAPVAPPGGGRGFVPPPPPPTGTEGLGGQPPAPPPIPLKFIGVLELPNLGKLAVFSDCRTTMRGKEGDIIDGRYRLVRIGVESVVMEYADGRGRTTIRESGQECVGK